jgi:hypothetical protein
VLRNLLPVGADERECPKRRRLRKNDAYRVCVDLLRFDTTVDSDRHRRGRRIGCELAVEDGVIGREGFAVVPAYVALELPDY